MKINTRFIKFSGKSEIEKDLIVGNNYEIVSQGTITAETITDLHDGTYAKSYKWEAIQSTVTGEKGESIKAKDTRGNSSLIRNQIYSIWLNSGSSRDFDSLYNDMCREYMKMADLIAKKLLENK